MKTLSSLFVVVALAGVAGCAASMPPSELLSARANYDRASMGPAAKVDPADLHTARVALDAAEQSFDRDGDTQHTRDLAYTAERRIEIAESRSRTITASNETAQIIAQMNESTADALVRANSEVHAKETALVDETRRRQEAEKRAAQTAADLARIASVKQEARGMVITLAGGVLFATNKSELLPSAQAKLSDVAKALVEQDPDSTIVVEGHTDSQGIDSANRELSQKRAQSVREYLVSHGVASDRITSEGFGASRPIADNKSVEGRANNRRVEIVVKPKTETMPK